MSQPLPLARARTVVSQVAGKAPQTVKVLFASDLRGAQLLRATFDDGLRVWVFEGDGATPDAECATRLREVCTERGCRNPLGPEPRIVADDGTRRAVCERHAPVPSPGPEGRPRRLVVVPEADVDPV